MALIVETPDTREPERDYILGVLLGAFPGLDWVRQPTDRNDVRITLVGQPDRALTLPDILFQMPADHWLRGASLPSQPLVRWDSGDLGLPVTLVDPALPVIYGDAAPAARRDDQGIHLPVDIFGSAFFMLTRYEEMTKPDRDEHDRFPAWASLAGQEGFLERPIVDEYVETLVCAMQSLWPNLQRRVHTPHIFVTCDVDIPYSGYTRSVAGTTRRVAGDLLKRRNPRLAWRTMRNTLATRSGDYRHDPLNTFDWMMDVNEMAGHHVAFYFLCGHTVPDLDGNYRLAEPRIRNLMRRIHERGHEIGIHGSYGTYRNAHQFRTETDALRHAMEEEGIDSSRIGARQHYLRWSAAETPQGMERAGVAYDTTLSHADHPGFRCGTARPYTWFNCLTREKLKLIERPLILMDRSMLSPKYGGAEYTEETLRRMVEYKERCHCYGGEFVLLWHNSNFNHQADRTFYESLISR